jgi:hypothetical protein
MAGTRVPLSRGPASEVREVATAASVTADSASCGVDRVGHGLPLVTHPPAAARGLFHTDGRNIPLGGSKTADI